MWRQIAKAAAWVGFILNSCSLNLLSRLNTTWHDTVERRLTVTSLLRPLLFVPVKRPLHKRITLKPVKFIFLLFAVLNVLIEVSFFKLYLHSGCNVKYSSLKVKLWYICREVTQYQSTTHEIWPYPVISCWWLYCTGKESRSLRWVNNN